MSQGNLPTADKVKGGKNRKKSTPVDKEKKPTINTRSAVSFSIFILFVIFFNTSI
jgi:hypothetical protein